jgi:two-component system CheB/CheR fusion protein
MGNADNKEDSLEAAPEKLAIVGIGASAGGLLALETFFENVPDRSGLSFVVVVHLAAESESILANLLQAHVRMPVRQVIETTQIEPDHVYVIPPGQNLEAVDTHLHLSSLEQARRDRAPVDHFLRTLARTNTDVSIGVILSGTGSDGTLGIKEIKQVGGLAVAQDPAEAEYDGMPQSAIATGLVDLVLPVAEIPGAIVRYVRARPNIPVPDEDEDVDGEQRQTLSKLLALVRGRTGRDFSRYKRSTLMRRIQRRMQLHQVEHFADYLDYVRSEPEARALSDEFLITVTNFFRDPEVFQTLADDVIPQLFDSKSPEDDIRVWSVGCATGEEAYSLAMLLIEESARREQPPELQVFASDLHERSLDVAREGLYSGNIEADVSSERLRRFFTKENEGYRVRRELRDLVVFAPHNLLSDPPFSKIDLISCRNLLIYLQRDVQRDVIELFHYALRPDGFLMLGASETVGRTDLFRVEDKKSCFYRKRNLPTRDPRLSVFAPVHRGGLGRSIQRQPSMERLASYAALHAQMLERHARPSVLLNQDHEVVHLSFGAGRYMRVPGGQPTANLFKMLRDELRLELRAALHTADKEHRSCRTEPVALEIDGRRRCVVVEIVPAQESHHEGLALLIFDEREAMEPPADALASAERVEAPATRELRDELEQTKQRLQGLIEKYETGQEEMRGANEELQSANEELRSTMEELETSKEELQSMNEELSTLNQENRHKVEELSELSSDLENLMAATDIATLFLDRDLQILRFTPRVGELFNVRLTDRGRPLTDLTHRLVYAEIASDAREVLEKLTPIEREVTDQSGSWYLARVLPYRAAQHRIGGVVITLIDITKRKQTEHALLERAEADAFRLELTDAIRPLVDPLEVQSTAARLLGEHFGANRVFYAELVPGGELGEVRTGYHEGVVDVVGTYHFDDHGPTLMNELRTGRTVIVTNVREDPRFGEAQRARAGELEVVAFMTVPVVKAAQAVGVFVVQQSEPRIWTAPEVALMEETVERMWMAAERVQAANSLRESEERYRELFDWSEDGFCIIDVLFGEDEVPVDYRFVVANPAFEAQVGITGAVGRRMRELAASHDADWVETYGGVAKTGRAARFEASAFGRFYGVSAFRVGMPKQLRVAVLFKDITERKRLEDQLAASNRRKDEFLATLAHELRNPLAPITNALALLRRHIKPERVEELYSMIERQLGQMIRLVDDLLDVSRITRGIIELRKQPVDLEQVVQTAVETSRPHIERGHRRLSVESSGQSVFVDGDPTRLVQIVANLLNNAAKFTEDGGQIWLTIDCEGDQAKLSVRDDGMGIPPSMLDKVFDMFAQLEAGRGGGLGIGLTLVRSLVALHHGSIEAHSEGLGHGSEFILRLPLCSASARVPAQPGAAEHVMVERACPILVVDDNQDAANSLALLLAGLGVEVKVAYEGQEALMLCHDWTPELVFLDLDLPGMDGFEIAQRLRSLPEGPAMKVIAVTGSAKAKDRQRGREAGFDQHLVKPVDPEALEALVAQHCRRSLPA